MKRLILATLAFFVIASCRNESGNNATDERIADTVVEAVPARVSAPPYNVEYDEERQELSLVRSNENLSAANVNDILRVINAKYEGIKLDVVDLTPDTVHLKIDDASKLTQQMGSAGAEAYLAEITFSLTELKDIKAVRIDFEEGDHAMPGVYTREYFKNVKIKK